MQAVLLFIAEFLWLALPAAVSNMMPIISKGILKWMAVPIDGGRKWKGKPIFGKSKTYRGFFVGILGAILICWLQSYLFSASAAMRSVTLVDYQEHNFILVGFLYGFGALFGDLIKSFIKRRVGVPPGGKFWPWDQLDLFIGALIFLSFVYIPPWPIILFLLILTPLLHKGLNVLGYLLKLKDRPW